MHAEKSILAWGRFFRDYNIDCKVQKELKSLKRILKCEAFSKSWHNPKSWIISL